MDEKNRSGGQEGVDFARLGDGRHPGRALAGDLPQRFRCFAPDSEGFVSAGPVGDLNRGDRFRVGVGGLHASREQSGVQCAEAETMSRLAVGNHAYEERFGYIYIVCASGKSAAELLAILESRLSNGPDAELRVAAGEQRQITRLRLEKWMTER